jgi:hypothetical protein
LGRSISIIKTLLVKPMPEGTGSVGKIVENS